MLVDEGSGCMDGALGFRSQDQGVEECRDGVIAGIDCVGGRKRVYLVRSSTG